MTGIDEIIDNFALLDDWDDRYRYVIELGRTLPPLAEAEHNEANKVRGCTSQVWLVTHVKPDGAGGPVLSFEGDSISFAAWSRSCLRSTPARARGRSSTPTPSPFSTNWACART